MKPLAVLVSTIFLAAPVFAQAPSAQGHPHGNDPRMIFAGFVLIMVMGIISVLIKAGWLSLSLLFSVVKPQNVISNSACLGGKLVKSFLAGLMILAFYCLLLGICKIFIPRSISFLVSVPVFVVMMIHVLAGFTAISHFIGEKILANVGSLQGGSTFMTVLWGGLILVLCGFVPFLGQITDLAVIATGLGVTTLNLGKRGT